MTNIDSMIYLQCCNDESKTNYSKIIEFENESSIILLN